MVYTSWHIFRIYNVCPLQGNSWQPYDVVASNSLWRFPVFSTFILSNKRYLSAHNKPSVLFLSTAKYTKESTHWGQWHINASVNWAIIAFNNVACPAPSHNLNQCWPVVYWTIKIKLQGNLCENLTIFIQKYYFNMPSEKWQPFCLVAVCLECYTRSRFF